MRFWKCCWFTLRATVVLAGILLFVLLALALTSLPGKAYAWLGKDAYTLKNTPTTIIVLGGGGIPSESGLMRTYLAADVSHRFPKTQVILSLPADDAPQPNQKTHVEKMKDELTMRGVSAERIQLETHSYNTHQQAITLYQHLTAQGDHPDVLLVTSGYHMKRALGTFRAAGFERIMGMPAQDAAVEADHGPLVRLRYEFWSNLQYYAIIARELTAMGVYKAKGWM